MVLSIFTVLYTVSCIEIDHNMAYINNHMTTLPLRLQQCKNMEKPHPFHFVLVLLQRCEIRIQFNSPGTKHQHYCSFRCYHELLSSIRSLFTSVRDSVHRLCSMFCRLGNSLLLPRESVVIQHVTFSLISACYTISIAPAFSCCCPLHVA